MRASDTSEVIFADCRVPASQSARRARGRASSTRCRCSTPAASGIAALSVGLAQGAYEAALDYAPRAAAVRPADRRVPGDSVEARRHGDPHRGGAAADLSRGLPEGRRRADDARVVHGEAVRQRSGGQGRRRLRADSRRLRLREGLSGREVLPRRQAPAPSAKARARSSAW